MGAAAKASAILLLAGAITAGGYVASKQQTYNTDSLPGPDVRIELHMKNGQGGTCSGVYLGDGIVLTAKHCIPDELASATVIFDNNGNDDGSPSIDAMVLWKSDKTDIAAYKISVNIPVKSASLACRAPVIGENIEVVGNPLGLTFIHTWGRVAGVSRTSPDGEQYLVPIDAMISSGNSGGPVYDSTGRVIGIADAVIQGQAPLGPGVGHVDLMVSSQAACEKFPSK